MEKIYLTKRYLKKPVYTIAISLIVALLIEGFKWIFTFEKKLTNVSEYGGILGYIYISLRSGIMPELATLFIIFYLIDLAHTLLKIYTVQWSWLAILRYELIFLPILTLAFFVFNPITQSVRYVLVNFPNYDFSIYWDDYIIGTYFSKLYSSHLIFLLLVSYISINLSLLSDSLRDFRIRKYRNTISG